MYNSTLEVFAMVKQSDRVIMGLPPLFSFTHKVTPRKHCFQWVFACAQGMDFRKVEHSLPLVGVTAAARVVGASTI